jgi:hypothetical protein
MTLVACGNSSKTKEMIEKLSAFTEMETGTNRYLFNYGDEWSIIYNEEIEVIRFKDPVVVDSLIQLFGEGCIPSVSICAEGFIYDPRQNQFRIYVNIKDDNGDISILEYYPSDKQFTVMADSKTSGGLIEYDVTEDFAAVLDSYGIAERMEERLGEFEKVMNENGFTMSDSRKLSYQKIVKALK